MRSRTRRVKRTARKIISKARSKMKRRGIKSKHRKRTKGSKRVKRVKRSKGKLQRGGTAYRDVVESALQSPSGAAETFAPFDSDGDGMISAQELPGAMASLGHHRSDAEIPEMQEMPQHRKVPVAGRKRALLGAEAMTAAEAKEKKRADKAEATAKAKAKAVEEAKAGRAAVEKARARKVAQRESREGKPSRRNTTSVKERVDTIKTSHHFRTLDELVGVGRKEMIDSINKSDPEGRSEAEKLFLEQENHRGTIGKDAVAAFQAQQMKAAMVDAPYGIFESDREKETWDHRWETSNRLSQPVIRPGEAQKKGSGTTPSKKKNRRSALEQLRSDRDRAAEPPRSIAGAGKERLKTYIDELSPTDRAGAEKAVGLSTGWVNPTGVLKGLGDPRPLHTAAYIGDTAGIDRLVREGAEVNAVDEYGNTPLHLAAAKGHAEAVEALARAGAELTAVNKAGDTPLDRAAREGHAEAVEALARAGAEVNAVSSDGLTPLAAQQQQQQEQEQERQQEQEQEQERQQEQEQERRHAAFVAVNRAAILPPAAQHLAALTQRKAAAIVAENYEEAARVRDEITRLEQQQQQQQQQQPTTRRTTTGGGGGGGSGGRGGRPPPLPSAGASSSSPWWRTTDKSGRPIWHNRETNDTSWSDPSLIPSTQPQKVRPRKSPMARPVLGAPPSSPWRRTTDKSGRPIWRNLETNDTSWSDPR
jgi:hypothetical protein